MKDRITLVGTDPPGFPFVGALTLLWVKAVVGAVLALSCWYGATVPHPSSILMSAGCWYRAGYIYAATADAPRASPVLIVGTLYCVVPAVYPCGVPDALLHSTVHHWKKKLLFRHHETRNRTCQNRLRTRRGAPLPGTGWQLLVLHHGRETSLLVESVSFDVHYAK